MNEQEEWRPVARCPLYEVSNRGRVRRITYKASYISQWGYPTVQLWQGNSRYLTVPIHRLVAEAFIPNPENLPEVNHEDFNKENCVAKNLKWITRLDNQRHMMKQGLRKECRGEDNGNSKFTATQVLHIVATKGRIPQRQLAKQYGVSQRCISAIFTGRSWQHLTKIRRGVFGVPTNAKLTKEQVKEIRASKHESPSTLAKRFGVKPGAIQCIWSGQTWKHVP